MAVTRGISSSASIRRKTRSAPATWTAFRNSPNSARILRRGPDSSRLADTSVQTVRGSWDAYYGNVADHLLHGRDLAVTAEQARDVVRVLDAALRSIETGSPVVGTWGS